MTLHAAAYAELDAWRAPEAEQERLRRDYLAHLDEYVDGMWRECLPGHLTASAAVLDASGERVLLTLHRKLRMWLQLGGHCEPGDGSLAEAALREAAEESGIAGLSMLAPGPVRLDRHAVPCGGGSWHLDVQYAMIAPAGAEPAIDPEESLDLRWWPVRTLPESADAATRGLVRDATALIHASR
ncbi:MAG: NUDIX domain-containing protein [Streptosporangiales bacterium]|nr:NUDIX domain-containing protein [Streptosporangiales bacterium]